MGDSAWTAIESGDGRVQGVAQGTLTVGDAVLFIALVQQLSAPLNYFGSFYRQIQTYMCGPPLCLCQNCAACVPCECDACTGMHRSIGQQVRLGPRSTGSATQIQPTGDSHVNQRHVQD